ncbi:MAG: 30S ribosomal protein S2 [Phycisphaerae bacterium]|nr:30S ribosomal protein S2 [Phycisphaerae bacterium]
MASELARQLIDSGIHFGHRVSRWNPKMAPFIFGKRNLIHIIDIRETLKGLLRAKKFLSQVVARGQDVLFVGTKRQARFAIEKQAERCGMHWVTERWLGGTLTNFRTIRSRLQRLEELEAIEAEGRLGEYSKKMIASLTRERRKIQRNLSGIRRMNRLPGVMVVVDVRREHIALKEAKKLGIPTVCLIDTDSDPDYADIPIPGNDDAMRAIVLMVEQLAEAIEEGKRARPATPPPGADAGPKQPKRARDVSARAGEEATAAPAEVAASEPPVDEVASPSGSTDAGA